MGITKNSTSYHCLQSMNLRLSHTDEEQKKTALRAERSLSRLGTPQARTWHAMCTREACHHHAIHMPMRAILVPPLCLWHANLVPGPAHLCAGRGAHLACPWRAGGLSLTFTQPSLFAIAILTYHFPYLELNGQLLS